jgi:three-Cys-motif partner protein
MSKPGQQKFGAAHTQVKLGALFSYLPAYTTALSSYGFTLHYVDAFAGTGKCTIRIGSREKTIPGSAWLALECKPPFHRLVFIEKVPSKVRQLRELVADPHFAQRDCRIQVGDANELLPAFLSQLGPQDRAVVNLDPFGMDVRWVTLEKIAASKIADVFYLFPLSSFYRQAAHDPGAIDANKEAALKRLLGPHDWRTALYSRVPQRDLFAQEGRDERSADAYRMTEWFTGCLRTIFPGVANPHILHLERPDGRRGAPLFALYFLVSNPSGKAQTLAMKIARAVFKRLQ